MNPLDPNIQLVEMIAKALDTLCEELLFVGGCAAGLLCTSQTAAPARVTYDVDVVAEVAALSGYHALEKQFSARGFVRDISEDAPICRWRLGEVAVDLMPTDPRVLGFANRWYPIAHETALRITLPSGKEIRLISAPAFLAAKLEAFATRGQGNLMASHDFEDIINVLDGRPEILDEVASTNAELANYLAASFSDIMHHPDFNNTLPGLVEFDELYDERVNRVRERINAIAEQGR